MAALDDYLCWRQGEFLHLLCGLRRCRSAVFQLEADQIARSLPDILEGQ
jgi:hypothetical protein